MKSVNRHRQEAIKWQEMDRNPGGTRKNGFTTVTRTRSRRSNPPSRVEDNKMKTLEDENKLIKISSSLEILESKGKYDLDGCNSTIELWQTIMDSSFWNFCCLKGIFVRLMKNLSRTLLSGKWLEVEDSSKEKLKSNISSIASLLDKKTMLAEERFCRAICRLLDTSIWQEEYLTKVLKESIDISSANALWEAEGWILIESRIEVLYRLPNLNPLANLTEACVLKGSKLHSEVDSKARFDNLNPYEMTPEKFYHIAAIFAISLSRLQKEDTESLSRLDPYLLLPGLANELMVRLCDAGNPHRVLPGWKHWKKDKEVALAVCQRRLEMTREIEDSVQVHNWFTMYLKLKYLMGKNDPTDDRDIEALTRDLSNLSSTPGSEAAMDKVLELSMPENVKNFLAPSVRSELVFIYADVVMKLLGKIPCTLDKVVELYVSELAEQCSTLYNIRANGDKNETNTYSMKLSRGFESLAKHFEFAPQMCFEVLLTSFSLNPSQDVLDRITGMVESSTGSNVDVSLKITPSENSTVGLRADVFVDFVNVVQSARVARLTCFRDNWAKFKALCVRHLATRGDDIKTGEDLDLAKPTDFSLYVGMKPAYDDNDTGYEAGYCPEELEELEENPLVPQKKPKKIREPAFRMRMLLEDSKPSKKCPAVKLRNDNSNSAHVVRLVKKLKMKPGPKPKLLIARSKPSSKSSKTRNKDLVPNITRTLSIRPRAAKSVQKDLSSSKDEQSEAEDPKPPKRKYSARKPSSTPRVRVQASKSRATPRVRALYPPSKLFHEWQNTLTVLPRIPIPFPTNGHANGYLQNEQKLLETPYIRSQTLSSTVQDYRFVHYNWDKAAALSKWCNSARHALWDYAKVSNSFRNNLLPDVSQDSTHWQAYLTNKVQKRNPAYDNKAVTPSQIQIDDSLCKTKTKLKTPPQMDDSSYEATPAALPQVEDSSYETAAATPPEMDDYSCETAAATPSQMDDYSCNTAAATPPQIEDPSSDAKPETPPQIEDSSDDTRIEAPPCEPIPIVPSRFILSECTGDLVGLSDDQISEVDDQDLVFSDFSDDEDEVDKDMTDGLDDSTEDEASNQDSINDNRKIEVLSEVTGEVVVIEDLNAVTVFLSESIGEFLEIFPCNTVEEDLVPIISPTVEEFSDSAAPLSSPVQTEAQVPEESSSEEELEVEVSEENEASPDEPVEYLGTFPSTSTSKVKPKVVLLKTLRVSLQKLNVEEIAKYDRCPIEVPVPDPDPSPPTDPDPPISIPPLKIQERRKSSPVVQTQTPSEKVNRCNSAETRRSSRRSRAQVIENEEKETRIEMPPATEKVKPQEQTISTVSPPILPVKTSSRGRPKRSRESTEIVFQASQENSRSVSVQNCEPQESVLPAIIETAERASVKRKKVSEVELAVTKSSKVKKRKTGRAPKPKRYKKKKSTKPNRKVPPVTVPRKPGSKPSKKVILETVFDELSEDSDEENEETMDKDDDPEFLPDTDIDNLVDDSDYECDEGKYEFPRRLRPEPLNIKMMEAYEPLSPMVWKRIIPDFVEPDIIDDVEDSETDPLALDLGEPPVISLISSDEENEEYEEIEDPELFTRQQPDDDDPPFPFPYISTSSFAQSINQALSQSYNSPVQPNVPSTSSEIEYPGVISTPEAVDPLDKAFSETVEPTGQASPEFVDSAINASPRIVILVGGDTTLESFYDSGTQAVGQNLAPTENVAIQAETSVFQSIVAGQTNSRTTEPTPTQNFGSVEKRRAEDEDEEDMGGKDTEVFTRPQSDDDDIPFPFEFLRTCPSSIAQHNNQVLSQGDDKPEESSPISVNHIEFDSQASICKSLPEIEVVLRVRVRETSPKIVHQGNSISETVDPANESKPEVAVDPVDESMPEVAVDPVDESAPEEAVDPVDESAPEEAVDPVDESIHEEAVDPVDESTHEEAVDPLDESTPEEPVDPLDESTAEEAVHSVNSMPPGIVKPVDYKCAEVVDPMHETSSEIVDPMDDTSPEVAAVVDDMSPEIVAPVDDMSPEIVDPVDDTHAEIVDPVDDTCEEIVDPVDDTPLEIVDPVGNMSSEIMDPVGDMSSEIVDPVNNSTSDVDPVAESTPDEALDSVSDSKPEEAVVDAVAESTLEEAVHSVDKTSPEIMDPIDYTCAETVGPVDNTSLEIVDPMAKSTLETVDSVHKKSPKILDLMAKSIPETVKYVDNTSPKIQCPLGKLTPETVDPLNNTSPNPVVELATEIVNLVDNSFPEIVNYVGETSPEIVMLVESDTVLEGFHETTAQKIGMNPAQTEKLTTHVATSILSNLLHSNAPIRTNSRSAAPNPTQFVGSTKNASPEIVILVGSATTEKSFHESTAQTVGLNPAQTEKLTIQTVTSKPTNMLQSSVPVPTNSKSVELPVQKTVQKTSQAKFSNRLTEFKRKAEEPYRPSPKIQERKKATRMLPGIQNLQQLKEQMKKRPDENIKIVPDPQPACALVSSHNPPPCQSQVVKEAVPNTGERILVNHNEVAGSTNVLPAVTLPSKAAKLKRPQNRFLKEVPGFEPKRSRMDEIIATSSSPEPAIECPDSMHHNSAESQPSVTPPVEIQPLEPISIPSLCLAPPPRAVTLKKVYQSSTRKRYGEDIQLVTERSTPPVIDLEMYDPSVSSSSLSQQNAAKKSRRVSRRKLSKKERARQRRDKNMPKLIDSREGKIRVTREEPMPKLFPYYSSLL